MTQGGFIRSPFLVAVPVLFAGRYSNRKLLGMLGFFLTQMVFWFLWPGRWRRSPAVADAGGDGHHVLDAAADLDPHHVARGVGPEGLAVEGVLHLAARSAPSAPPPSPRWAAPWPPPWRRTARRGWRCTGGAATGSTSSSTSLMVMSVSTSIPFAAVQTTGVPAWRQALGLDGDRPHGVRGDRHHHQLGPLQGSRQVGLGAERRRKRDARQVAVVLVPRRDGLERRAIGVPDRRRGSPSRRARQRGRCPRSRRRARWSASGFLLPGTSYSGMSNRCTGWGRSVAVRSTSSFSRPVFMS